MSNRPKICSISSCCDERSKYSTRNMCMNHDELADQQEKQAYIQSPKFFAIEAIEQSSTLDDLKSAIIDHLTDLLGE